METFALLKFVLLLLLLPFESCKRNECASGSFAVQKALHTLQRSEKYCRRAQYAALKRQRHAYKHTHTHTHKYKYIYTHIYIYRLHQTLCKYHISGWGMLLLLPPKKLQLKRSQAAQNNTRDNLPFTPHQPPPCTTLCLPHASKKVKQGAKQSAQRGEQPNLMPTKRFYWPQCECASVCVWEAVEGGMP